MNVVSLLVQLFEEAGYKKEKQVRMKKISFVGPAPGTYRFDRWWNGLNPHRAYLTTRSEKHIIEFYITNSSVVVYKGCYKGNKTVIDLADPTSIDQILDLIKD